MGPSPRPLSRRLRVAAGLAVGAASVIGFGSAAHATPDDTTLVRSAIEADGSMTVTNPEATPCTTGGDHYAAVWTEVDGTKTWEAQAEIAQDGNWRMTVPTREAANGRSFTVRAECRYGSEVLQAFDPLAVSVETAPAPTAPAAAPPATRAPSDAFPMPRDGVGTGLGGTAPGGQGGPSAPVVIGAAALVAVGASVAGSRRTGRAR